MLHRGKNIISKAIAVLFFLVVAAPLFFSSILLIKQQCARYKMKETLETGLLHTLTLPENDIVWVKKNKEIRIGKDLFDVKSISKENDKMLVTGLFDHEETEIDQKLGHLSGNPDSPNNILIKLFTLLQNIFSSTCSFEIQYDFTCQIENTFDSAPSLPELAHQVITPPPQTVIFC